MLGEDLDGDYAVQAPRSVGRNRLIPRPGTADIEQS